jgi:hypothetical protein
MKKVFSFILAVCLVLPAMANEGMWLPLLLNRNYADMQRYGLQLSPEELYSVNNSSLKDAIVSFGGFCTGEIISKNGLVLTNHHCGYGAIQSHSTVENNILENGFFAKSYSEEKTNPDLFVRFLVRMEDVTSKVNATLSDTMSEAERSQQIAKVGRSLSSKATEGTDYDANVKSFYHGNEFYLFVYETYRDVRLVGAPPESVGKFGGDTDNWMWPRHTGDFSMFRVYTAPDGSPATYAEDNIPMKPKHHLPISLAGVKEGDFTMVWGYPGSTDRFLSSFGVQQAIDLYNPTVVKIRDLKLKIMKQYMDEDPATRIAYASKYAQVANYWKYYIGQTAQLKSNKVLTKKQLIEEDFRNWVSGSAARKAKYGEALDMLQRGYKTTDPYIKSKVYVLEAGLLGAATPLFAFRFNRSVERYEQTKVDMKIALKEVESDKKDSVKTYFNGRLERMQKALEESVENHYADYNGDLERDLLANTLQLYYNSIPKEQHPAFFEDVEDDFDGDFYAFAQELFEESIFTDKERSMKAAEKLKSKKLRKDWAVRMGNDFFATYQAGGTTSEEGLKALEEAEDAQEKGYRLFTAGLREMNPKRNYSADANSTMRMTYGTVGSYKARDAVKYDHYTTAQGILEKADPNNFEFNVPNRLLDLIEGEDFGQYANDKGELPVCFIHNTDITGGNSGSPVINGKGHLIGCAFDGNWEAMSGDIFFEDRLQRTISVDARYILFIVDKYAGATNIIDELTLVRASDMAKEKPMPEEMPAVEPMPTEVMDN